LSVPDEGYSLSVPDEGYFECTWWRLFQKRVVRTKYYLYVFIIISMIPWDQRCDVYQLNKSNCCRLYMGHLSFTLKNVDDFTVTPTKGPPPFLIFWYLSFRLFFKFMYPQIMLNLYNVSVTPKLTLHDNNRVPSNAYYKYQVCIDTM
jgi:hypothetical protein